MAKKYAYRHTEMYHGFRIDVKADSPIDLARKLDKRKAAIDRQVMVTDSRLKPFALAYLENYKRQTVSDAWYADLKAILNCKIVPALGNRPLDRIRLMEVQHMLNGCSDLSDSYVKKIYDLTRQIFHHAYKNGLTPSDFSEDLIRPRGRKGKSGRSLTDQETAALLSVCQGTPDELFLRIMLQCGLRPGEVTVLTWKDIDLSSGTISVNKAMKKDRHVGLPKSDAGNRTVPIPDDLIPVLKSAAGSPFDLVCPKQRGGFHTKSSLRKLWTRTQSAIDAALSAGGSPVQPVRDPLRLYDLRHTYCTNLEKAGVPINIAARLMGHSDISVTSKIYTHASNEALELARSLINGRAASPAPDARHSV